MDPHEYTMKVTEGIPTSDLQRLMDDKAMAIKAAAMIHDACKNNVAPEEVAAWLVELYLDKKP